MAMAFAVVAVVNGDTYTWNGRPTMFNDGGNWNGPNPYDSESGGLIIGQKDNKQSKVAISVPSADFQVGKMLSFVGPTTLLLGDGTGKTSFMFNPQSTQPNSTFTPQSDFLCSQNWQVQQKGKMVVPDTPPCSDDVIKLKPDNVYYIEIPQPYGVQRIGFGTGSAQTSCTNGQTLVTSPGSYSGVSFVGGCSDSRLGSSASSACPDTTCTYSPTPAEKTPTLSPSSKVVLPNAPTKQGQTFPPTKPGQTFPPVATPPGSTDSPSQFTMSPTAGPTVDPNPQGSVDNSAASFGTVVIIVVVIVVLLLVLVLVVIIAVVKRSKSSNNDDRGIQSFENPMYDSTEQDTQHQSANTQDSSGGYMDVPANNASTGYMDVPMAANDTYNDGFDDNDGAYETPSNDASGYMDVAPQNHDDDFEDDDEDV